MAIVTSHTKRYSSRAWWITCIAETEHGQPIISAQQGFSAQARIGPQTKPRQHRTSAYAHLVETVAQQTDQRCDEENVRHAYENDLIEVRFELYPRFGGVAVVSTMSGAPRYGDLDSTNQR